MYRFWDIADLGFSHFYFSCKNYQELAQSRITKVVGYFTTNPTKLVLRFSDFSTIFYAIYKNQQNGFNIWVTNLQEGPRKEVLLCNVVLVAGSGGPAEIPAGDRRIPAGEGGGVV
jgi:hypothetical protein